MSLRSLNRPHERNMAGRPDQVSGEKPETNWVRIGKVIRPHGIGGALSVYIDEPDRLQNPPGYVYIVPPRGVARQYRVLKLSPHRGGGILLIEGITTRDQAEDLRNAVLFVEREHAVPLAEDEYYIHDLKQCLVLTVEGKTVGHVIDVWPLPHHDILMVRQENESTILIPFIRVFVTQVNVFEKRIVVSLPENYLSIYTSGRR